MRRTAQPALPAPVPIEGFAYQPDLVDPELEREMVARFVALDFREFEFQGFRGRRRVVSFGVRYDFGDGNVHQAPDIPDFLQPLRDLAATFAGLVPWTLKHALVTEYQPGAAIGWHRDRPVFKDVIGISLLSPCRLRLRRKVGAAGNATPSRSRHARPMSCAVWCASSGSTAFHRRSSCAIPSLSERSPSRRLDCGSWLPARPA